MAQSKSLSLLTFLLLAMVSSLHSQQIVITDAPESFRCANITGKIEWCTAIGYNMASFPNWRDQGDSLTAKQELKQYLPVIQTACSEAIVHMLCAVYAPFCETDKPNIRLPPCKELCQAVRDGCESVFLGFGYPLPPPLNCDRYPSFAVERLAFCSDNISMLRIPDVVPGVVRSNATAAPPDSNSTGDGSVLTPPPSPPITLTCPRCLRVQGSLVNRSYTFAGIDNCAIPCGGAYFTELERNTVAPAFILTAAIICVLFTLFTVATFLIDRHRFHYPERPIIYLSFCYLIISVAYIVGSISKVAGGNNDSYACSETNSLVPDDRSYVFQHLPDSTTTYKNASCVILFVLVYYFQMASAIWWVILTLTWFLAAAMKWGEEAVERLWLLYHVIAWSIPAIQVILVLALQLVDGDQLAGLCYTGETNPIGLGVFVFFPLSFYLSVGIVFLVIGFTALINISREVQNDHLKARKIGRLILRIGIYSLLYTIPNIVLLILHVYQLAKTADWEQSYSQCPTCETQSSASCSTAEYPSFAAFLIRYIMLFTIGICSTSWVLSSKTFSAWHRFFCSCGCNQTITVAAAPNATYAIPEKKEGDLSVHTMHPQTAV